MSESLPHGVLKRHNSLLLRLGGEKHRGWLPPGAAKPLPMPVREVLVDLEIGFDGSGFLLFCAARDGSFCWDSWHESLEGAQLQAAEDYGVTEWSQVPSK